MIARRGSRRGAPRLGAASALLAMAALLLFCWPVVALPPLSLAQAWAHLYGAWALVIAAILVLARSIGSAGGVRERRRRDERA